MPPRLVRLALVLFWIYAAWSLFRRDILPDLIVGPPPDLRAIASSGDQPEGPVHWAILVDDDDDPTAFSGRSVGQAVTETVRQEDGGVQLTSHAWFDTDEFFDPKGTPGSKPESSLVGTNQADRLEIDGSCWIDRDGNLERFRVALREGRISSADLLVIEGRLRNDRIEIKTSGLVPYLGPLSFPYKPHGIVQSNFGPLDRLPRLHVGQNWESQIVSPLTGQVTTARVDVVGTRIISWDGNPVTTLEVLTRTAGLSTRTWVRRDGLVLRQEVPIPLVRLVLERIPRVDPPLDPNPRHREP